MNDHVLQYYCPASGLVAVSSHFYLQYIISFTTRTHAILVALLYITSNVLAVLLQIPQYA